MPSEKKHHMRRRKEGDKNHFGEKKHAPQRDPLCPESQNNIAEVEHDDTFSLEKKKLPGPKPGQGQTLGKTRKKHTKNWGGGTSRSTEGPAIGKKKGDRYR